jgi:acetyl-CoA carboxylase, biotin carboxylase subunit
VTAKRFKRVLIANRGEIAVRIARTLRQMGIEPIAVFSDADRCAPHVASCDYAYFIGAAPARESYLRADKILEIAKLSGADAIHPGYGFLSENAAFAQEVGEAGLTFIGPSPHAMRVMGSKTSARDAVKKAGVPYVPGSDGALKTDDEARTVAAKIGYPVMLKASAGGGGKGMRMVHHEADLISSLRAARSEAQNAFGDEAVYMEKVVVNPRHVEIQVFGGPDGKAVWLGERECSMQRRHQKVIEETPSPIVDEDLRLRMGEVACRAAEAVQYVGAGTIEFLVDQENNFYFLEMNTRLQVEHPVTELCCGADLVAAQITVAQGEALPWRQDEIQRRGHAIEARIYAEDPAQNFLPQPGMIDELHFPQGPFVRVDCGVAAGFEVTRFYDPMIAKISVWGETRKRAIARMSAALEDTVVKGITTNTPFLRELLASKAFASGDYHTGSIAQIMLDKEEAASSMTEVAVIARVIQTFRNDSRPGHKPAQTAGRSRNWRNVMSRFGGG